MEGTYWLSVWSDTYGKCTVSGIEHPEGQLQAVLTADGEDVTPLRIVVTTSDRTRPARWVRCYFDIPLHRVQGTVLGPDQVPVEGIDVRLYGLTKDDNVGPWTDQRTGLDGVFTIEVPRGSYRFELSAEVEGGGTCSLGNYGADGRPADGELTRLFITDEDAPGFVITLPDVPSRLCHWTEGIVTTAEGGSPDGLSFSFHRVLRSGTRPHGATTDAAGTFGLPLLGGTYRLYIRSGTYDKCTVSGIENPEGRPGAEFPLEGGDSSQIQIAVAASGRAQTGSLVLCNFDVPFYRVQGTVVGPAEEPVEGIDVRLYGRFSRTQNAWTGKETGPDGTFAVEVPEGSYRLHLTAQLENGGTCVLGSYGDDRYRTDIPRPSGDTTWIDVTGADTPRVTITLADIPSALCHEVEVVVTDAGGEPPDRVTLYFERVLQSATVPHTAATDATGTVSLPLLGGTYRFYVWADTYDQCTVSGLENPEGRLHAVSWLEGGSASHLHITVAISEHAEQARWVRCGFDVPFYRVRGTVQGPDQEPLEGIEVRLHGKSGGDISGPWTAERTGPDGTFTIDAPAGSYLFELAIETEHGMECRLGQFGAGGRPAESGDATQFRVSNTDLAGIDLALTEAPAEVCHEIQGVVTDADGKPLADVSLTFFGNGQSQTLTTDQAGTFRVHGREGGLPRLDQDRSRKRLQDRGLRGCSPWQGQQHLHGRWRIGRPLARCVRGASIHCHERQVPLPRDRHDPPAAGVEPGRMDGAGDERPGGIRSHPAAGGHLRVERGDAVIPRGDSCGTGKPRFPRNAQAGHGAVGLHQGQATGWLDTAVRDRECTRRPGRWVESGELGWSRRGYRR